MFKNKKKNDATPYFLLEDKGQNPTRSTALIEEVLASSTLKENTKTFLTTLLPKLRAGKQGNQDIFVDDSHFLYEVGKAFLDRQDKLSYFKPEQVAERVIPDRAAGLRCLELAADLDNGKQNNSGQKPAFELANLYASGESQDIQKACKYLHLADVEYNSVTAIDIITKLTTTEGFRFGNVTKGAYQQYIESTLRTSSCCTIL